MGGKFLRVTIHDVEIQHIKNIITNTKFKKRKNLEGSLHGLYTESYQPVVLITSCGGGKKNKESDLCENHKLYKLGKWIVTNPKEALRSSKDVTLIFNDKGEFIKVYDDKEGQEATLDILEGQSAFREYHNSAAELKHKTKLCSSIKTERVHETHHQPQAASPSSNRYHITDSNSGHTNDVVLHTRTLQWYNNDRNAFAHTLDFVRRTFTDNEQVEIYRNTSTENITFKFRHSHNLWAFEFPAEFPRGEVKLNKIDGEKEAFEYLSLKSANFETMKNVLQEKFVKMCNCTKNCRNRQIQTWV